jgi:hypothetical protein
MKYLPNSCTSIYRFCKLGSLLTVNFDASTVRFNQLQPLSRFVRTASSERDTMSTLAQKILVVGGNGFVGMNF